MNAQKDDISQYEVAVPSNDLSQYEVHPTEESVGAYILRGGARVASRVGESLIGLPGALRELAGLGVIKTAEAITGKEQTGLREKLIENRKAPLPYELREKTAELTGGYTEPKTEGEELADEFLTDLTLLAMPVKGRIPFARALGIDVAGHLGKDVVKKFGGGETAQELSKLGTFFLTGLVTSPGSAGKFVNTLYKERDSLLPQAADVDATVLNKSLHVLKGNLEKGVPGTAENSVLNYVDTLIGKTQGGRIPVEELTTVKRQINERIGELVKKEGIKRKDARQLFKPLGREIERTLEAYGKVNPPFLKAHKEANQAYGAIEQSKKVTEFIRDKVPNANKLAAGLAFEAYALGLPAVAQTVGGAGLAFGGLKGAQILHRINASPVLRKYYMGVIKNAMNENAAVAAKNLMALDISMQKEDPELYQYLQSQYSSSERKGESSEG